MLQTSVLFISSISWSLLFSCEKAVLCISSPALWSHLKKMKFFTALTLTIVPLASAGLVQRLVESDATFDDLRGSTLETVSTALGSYKGLYYKSIGTHSPLLTLFIMVVIFKTTNTTQYRCRQFGSNQWDSHSTFCIQCRCLRWPYPAEKFRWLLAVHHSQVEWVVGHVWSRISLLWLCSWNHCSKLHDYYGGV